MLGPDPAGVAAEFRRRAEALNRIRRDPSCVPALHAYYALHPADFIDDWGFTIDPRLPEIGLPSMVPFKLFPRQRELVRWVLDRYEASETGVMPKSRDVGASWVTMALACTLCLFRPGIHIGFGSRKAEYIDVLGAPKALFPRGRQFLQNLPGEFLSGWDVAQSPHMRIMFPHNGSAITGEAGDNIGRGDRASIYFVDEAAFLERPQLIENSLSATTNCRIDLSSANGTNNPFYEKVVSLPPERVFRFHWRDHPYRDDAWYAKQVATLPAVTVAQEIDLNFTASTEGIIIPSAWVQSAMGAAARLGLPLRGERRISLDVADEGVDTNAAAGMHGLELALMLEWSGKGSDLLATTERAFGLCDDFGVSRMGYDSDGLGLGLRGHARGLNEQRTAAGRSTIEAQPFRAGADVLDPDKPIETVYPVTGKDRAERTNGDTFRNFKAQAWHHLQLKFERTHLAVTQGAQFDPDDLISISMDLPADVRGKLTAELSQPTWTKTSTGLLLVDKVPNGARSPNLADAVMMVNAPAPRRKSSFLGRKR